MKELANAMFLCARMAQKLDLRYHPGQFIPDDAVYLALAKGNATFALQAAEYIKQDTEVEYSINTIARVVFLTNDYDERLLKVLHSEEARDASEVYDYCKSGYDASRLMKFLKGLPLSVCILPSLQRHVRGDRIHNLSLYKIRNKSMVFWICVHSDANLLKIMKGYADDHLKTPTDVL